MPPGIQASVIFFFHLGILVQDLHHRSLLLLIFNHHTASPANVFDNIDDLAEAGGCTACLSEARETEVGAATVFENDEEFDDEGDGLDLQVYTHSRSALYSLGLVIDETKAALHRKTRSACKTSISNRQLCKLHLLKKKNANGIVGSTHDCSCRCAH
jgi:hypothetical protein